MMRFYRGLNKCILPELVINDALDMYSGTPTNCVRSVKTADSCSATFKIQISPRKTLASGHFERHTARPRERYSHSNTTKFPSSCSMQIPMTLSQNLSNSDVILVNS
jgi:hypothetical protein